MKQIKVTHIATNSTSPGEIKKLANKKIKQLQRNKKDFELINISFSQSTNGASESFELLYWNAFITYSYSKDDDGEEEETE